MRVDWVSFVFATVLAAGGAVAFGGLALRHGLTTSAASRVVQGQRAGTASPRQRRLRNVLVVVQLAVALALVSGSALMAQSLWRITQVPLGFEPASMLTAEVGLPGRRAGQHQAIYQALVDRLRVLPGVLSVSAGSFAPLGGAEHVFPVVADDEPRQGVVEPVLVKFVMPDYFRTMGIRLQAGVSLEEVDVTPSPVWLSATLAERLFKGRNAVGRHVRRLEENGEPVTLFNRAAGFAEPVAPFTVAGVVNEVIEETSRLGPSPVLYVPVRSPVVERSLVPTSMTLLLRTSGPPMDAAASVRSIVHDVDRSLSAARIRPMADIVNASTGTERFLAILLSFGAVVSLFLGLVGVYGVAAESVKRRTQEIGIRMALGAQRRQIKGLVMREATTIALIGLAFGLTTTLAAAGGLRSFLFAVAPTDAMTLGVATAVLATAAVVAIYWPARRAAHLEPVKALRGE